MSYKSTIIAPLIALVALVRPYPAAAQVVPDTGYLNDAVPGDSVPETGSRCLVKIERVLVEDGELYDTLDILVESGGVDLAGCVLKLAIQNPYVDIIEILPGEIIDSCGWELFRAGEVEAQHPALGPLEIWQVTTLAQGITGRQQTICFGFDRPASLARVVVSSAHVPVVPDTNAAIFFFWESCRDNVISDREGESLLVSDTVCSSVPIALHTERDQFPTLFGTPSECISPRALAPPRRRVEFHNGGVEFQLKIK